MATPRGRYMAVITRGSVDLVGNHIEFRALKEDINERLNEAISQEWGVLDEGCSLLVLRYTQQLQLQVDAVKPVAWAHEFKTASRPGGES